MPDRDSLAIIIVTYNSKQEIDACLDSIVGHDAFLQETKVIGGILAEALADGEVAA